MTVSIDIRKSFPAFKLDVAVEAGNETVGFLGASGCGKSLTLRCIAGVETPDEGRIVVNGKTFFDSAKKVNLSPQRRKTALLFQNYMLFPNMTVAENISAGISRKAPKAEMHEIVSDQLRRFNLRGFGKRYPLSLSGGQQQRVAIARMLVANPGILMLDEPFSALDLHLRESLEQDMLDLFEDFDGTILYVSHDIDEAIRFCDRIAVFDDGRVTELAETFEIVERPKSLATLKITGVKNIAVAEKAGEHKVWVPEWGMELRTTQTVPDDVGYLGIRASELRAVGEGAAALPPQEATDNVVELEVRRVSDSRFYRLAVLEPGRIRWRLNRKTISEKLLPERGDRIKLQFPPDKINLVTVK
jgi:molybdate transport system ATP-binding protein